MPKVSIIIPVYNAASTLKRCIDSIQGQTLSDFEVILVDDGSNDESGCICDAISNQDRRFKVIHKKNEGVASARQSGIEIATGDYAIHVDPDDWIESSMLEDLVTEAIKKNTDILICDYFDEYNGRIKYINQQPSSLDSETILTELFQKLHGSCCNKLIASDYYNKVSFVPKLNLSEDLLYICKILLLRPKIGYLNNAYYHYVHQSTGTMSTTYTRQRFLQLYQIFSQLKHIFSNLPDIKVAMIKSFLPYLSYVGLKAHDVSSKEFTSVIAPYRLAIWHTNATFFIKSLTILASLRLKFITDAIFFISSKFSNK
ncbi:glycosyltransferase family 2 protein [Muribaculum intestinale]|uniref:glycosyltransferase family 2 protein n=1 Tax=Muribaculum intestinale TaxID=1796646 RepID=UPI0025A99CDD|nr:glycosyltransferase family 2 protein [Muribaculum intestinale]